MMTHWSYLNVLRTVLMMTLPVMTWLLPLVLAARRNTNRFGSVQQCRRQIFTRTTRKHLSMMWLLTFSLVLLGCSPTVGTERIDDRC